MQSDFSFRQKYVLKDASVFFVFLLKVQLIDFDSVQGVFLICPLLCSLSSCYDVTVILRDFIFAFQLI